MKLLHCRLNGLVPTLYCEFVRKFYVKKICSWLQAMLICKL